MFIKPTKDAMDLFDYSEAMYMDAMLYTAHEDVPCPWDADILIEGGLVVLTGALGSGGPSGTSCVCKCTIDDFPKYYKLEVPDELVNSLGLEGSGWIEA